MQNGSARIGRIGIRAMLQQHHTELVIGVDGRHAQGAGTVGRRVIHVGAMSQQDLGYIDMAVADGE